MCAVDNQLTNAVGEASAAAYLQIHDFSRIGRHSQLSPRARPPANALETPFAVNTALSHSEALF